LKQRGWERLDDGVVLELASVEFDVFVTVDKDLPHQQNLSRFDIGVIVLRARTTRLADLRELLGALRAALDDIKPSEVRILSWRDR